MAGLALTALARALEPLPESATPPEVKTALAPVVLAFGGEPGDARVRIDSWLGIDPPERVFISAHENERGGHALDLV